MCEKNEEEEEEQEEIIKLSLFVYTLEYTRPCASGERAIGMYSREMRLSCANSGGMSIRHTHTTYYSKRKGEGEEINYGCR